MMGDLDPDPAQENNEEPPASGCSGCGKVWTLTPLPEEPEIKTTPPVEFSDSDGYDTDLEDEVSAKNEYDSSGKDNYIKICKDLHLVPVSHFMRHIKDQYLSLKHYNLGCTKTIALTGALVSNTYVESLDLTDNAIGSVGGSAIANMLADNYFITELVLDDNNLGLEGVSSICRILVETTYVKTISLAGNHLKDGSAVAISEMLKQDYSLSKLNVSRNDFSCVGITALSTALTSNDSLSNLDLSWNRFRSKGGVALGKMIGTNTGLTSLNLSNNGLDLAGAKSLAKGIKANTSLICLDVSSTRLPGSSMKDLGKSLGANTTLRILKLGLNAMQEIDLDILLKGLSANTSLVLLGLQDISVSRAMSEKLSIFEEAQNVVIDYGHSGGHQRSRPMTGTTLLLDEFITSNINKLAPLFLAKDKDKTGEITSDDFKTCLKEAGLRIHEGQLNSLVDRIDISNEEVISCKNLLGGSIPLNLEKLRSKKKGSAKRESVTWK